MVNPDTDSSSAAPSTIAPTEATHDCPSSASGKKHSAGKAEWVWSSESSQSAVALHSSRLSSDPLVCRLTSRSTGEGELPAKGRRRLIPFSRALWAA